MKRISKRFPFTAAVTALGLVAYGSMLRTRLDVDGLLYGAPLLRSVGWAGLAFVVYVAALIWNERRGLSTKWIWVTAVGFRLILIMARPAFSDDVYRYIWDGHLLANGVSPYAHTVRSPELDYLDIPQRTMVNHSWMASPYLPGAQLLFWVISSIGAPRQSHYQLIMVVFDLLSALIITRLLAMASFPSRRILIYLWNPLVIVEVAYSAHVDALMLFLTLASVYLTLVSWPIPEPSSLLTERAGRAASANWRDRWRSARTLLAPVSLALATLTKVLPVLLLPILFWRWSWRQRVLYGTSLLILLLPSGVIAGWGIAGSPDGTGVFGALRIFADQWNFNSGFFHWLERWLGAPGYGAPDPAAKSSIVIIMVSILLAITILARQPAETLSTLRLLAVPLMAVMVFSPTVHPWYALIVLGFLPFLCRAPGGNSRRWLLAAPWIYLSGALFLSYLTYIDRFSPGELEWVRSVEWLPTLAMLVSYLLAETTLRLMRWGSPMRTVSSAKSDAAPRLNQ